MKGRSLALVVVCCIATSLLAVSGTLLALGAVANSTSECSVPGDHATIQAAVDDVSCDSIKVGVGTFDETITVGRSVSIEGQGPLSTTVDGQGSGSVVIVPSGVAAALADLAIVGGGGGVRNEGILTITDCLIDGNGWPLWSTDQRGAGVFNDGMLTVIHSTVSSNTHSVWQGEGGGIYNGSSGLLALIDSLVTGNEAYDGAGIVNEGTAYVISSTLSHNHANQGSAVFNHNRMTIISSTLANNRATYRGGAILTGGQLTFTNSTISGNVVETDQPLVHNGGGGIFNYGGGEIVMTNSTLSGNSAIAGGAILAFTFEQPVISMTNSTLYSNTAATQGGGIRMFVVTPTVSAVNSIIAGNPGGDCAGGTILSRGYNINGDDSCGLDATGDLTETDPKLDSLGDYGGPTLTHQPLSGSPAIDAGDDSRCPVMDQRGSGRPKDGDGDSSAHCDIGSVEALALVVTPVVWLPLLGN